jgi:hypothetical protein
MMRSRVIFPTSKVKRACQAGGGGWEAVAHQVEFANNSAGSRTIANAISASMG